MSDLLVFVAHKYGGPVLVVLGLAWSLRASCAAGAVFNRYYHQYSNHLDRRLALLFLPSSGRRIVAIQIAVILGLVSFSVWTRIVAGYGLAVLVAAAPVAYLHRARQVRVRRLEDQVDSLITGLANALKTVPSPAAAMAQVVSVLPAPMRLEIERLLKEMRLGSTLEQSLLSMSSRLKSPTLDSALSAVLIGLQVGGNLPNVLQTTAETIREMNRLEGVVRAKTAEGRAQLWVLALLPFVLCFAFSMLDRDYFALMRTTVLGNVLVAAAGTFWLMSLLMAHKILKVDI